MRGTGCSRRCDSTPPRGWRTQSATRPRRCHARWFLALAEGAEGELSGEHQTRWLSVLELEHDNARAALAFLLEAGESELALRLTVALSRFWYVRGHLGEARRHLEAVLPSATGEDPLLLRRAQTAGASIALLQGDYAASTAFAEAALVSARRAGEPRFVANGLSNLGAIVLAAGDEQRAEIVLEEAVSLAREVGDERVTALALNNLGDLALSTGDYRRAAPLFEESLEPPARARGHGEHRTLAVQPRSSRADARRRRRRRPRAFASRWSSRARRTTRRTSRGAWRASRPWLRMAGDGERAATLSGAAGALLRAIGADFKPFERRLHESTEDRARSLCGSSAFEEASGRGAAMTLDAVLDLASGVRPSAEVA